MAVHNKKPGLLQVLPALGPSGGVERGTLEIARAAVAKGFRSYVASAGGPLVATLFDQGSKHITLPLADKSPLAIYRNAQELASLITTCNIDILHARSRAPAWSSLLAAKRTGCAWVTTFHGTYNFNNPLKKWYNSVMAKGDGVIAISDFIKDHMLAHYAIPANKITVIHRGVDLDYFNPQAVSPERTQAMRHKLAIPEGRPVIILPARMARWKGHHTLIHAISLLPSRSLTCLLVGDAGYTPAYVKELQQLIRSKDLQGVVSITGVIQDMPALYSVADIVVSASLEPEAFGRTIAEAQAMGRCMIATQIGGACETIIDRQTGWLVPPADPVALSGTITEILALSPQERLKVGKQAMDHIRSTFSLTQMCDKTIALYQQLLAE